MSFTKIEFDKGIEYWKKQVPRWPADYHNEFYKKLSNSGLTGQFNKDWWEFIWPYIRSWYAYRGKTKLYLTEHYYERMIKLQEVWDKDIKPLQDQDISLVKWETIEEFTSIVAEIKNSSTPVFTSKVCHFLAPQIFPVTDNKASGLPNKTYKEYFYVVQNEWAETDRITQDELIKMMKDIIGVDIFNNYPIKCKIIDICLIGRNN